MHVSECCDWLLGDTWLAIHARQVAAPPRPCADSSRIVLPRPRDACPPVQGRGSWNDPSTEPGAPGDRRFLLPSACSSMRPRVSILLQLRRRLHVRPTSLVICHNGPLLSIATCGILPPCKSNTTQTFIPWAQVSSTTPFSTRSARSCICRRTLLAAIPLAGGRFPGFR